MYNMVHVPEVVLCFVLRHGGRGERREGVEEKGTLLFACLVLFVVLVVHPA